MKDTFSIKSTLCNALLLLLPVAWKDARTRPQRRTLRKIASYKTDSSHSFSEQFKTYLCIAQGKELIWPNLQSHTR